MLKPYHVVITFIKSENITPFVFVGIKMLFLVRNKSSWNFRKGHKYSTN